MTKTTNKIPNLQTREFHGKTQYRFRFYFTATDGSRKRDDTGWWDSIAEAEKARKDELHRRENELKDLDLKIERSRSGTIRTSYMAFVDELEADADDNNYTEQIGGKRSLFRDARTLGKNYLPDDIAKIKTKSVRPEDFARWLRYLNVTNKKDRDTDQRLSGTTVRKYRGILIRFVGWLSDMGYVRTQYFKTNAINTLRGVSVKKRHVGARTDRNYPTHDDLQTILFYYSHRDEWGLAKYENEYWYNFYQLLFYTGMRVSEIVGLRWRDVDFTLPGTIYIHNAIEEREKRETVMKRLAYQREFVKNVQSVRMIPMMAAYYDYLQLFKEDSQFEFNYSDKELEDAFVFPNIGATDPKNRRGYQRHANLLRQTDHLSKVLGLPKFDNQMFRHGCATWLVLEQRFAEADLFRYFGHTDSKMLRTIYAKLSAPQETAMIRDTMSPLMVKAPEPPTEPTSFESEDDYIAYYTSDEYQAAERQRMITAEANSPEMMRYRRRLRLQQQMYRAIDKGQRVFEYRELDQELIDEILAAYPDIPESLELKPKIKK